MVNKNILIIGASTGIGEALKSQLLSAGAKLWSVSRSDIQIEHENHIKHIRMDVLSDEWNTEAFPEIIDGLIYCPGSIVLKPFRSLKAEQFRADYELNVVAAVNAIQSSLKALKKSDAAAIVLFSTVASFQGMPFHSSIAAAKSAVEGLGRSLAAELAPKIRVNVIAPSLTDTPLAANLLNSDERREAAAKRHPLKSYGDPAQIAATAKFLLSDDSSWISGQVIAADGGLSRLRV